MFKARLNYIGTSGLAWATEDLCQKREEHTCLVRSTAVRSTAAVQHCLDPHSTVFSQSQTAILQTPSLVDVSFHLILLKSI